MRILICEDSVLLRAGLVRLLDDAGHDVVAALPDASELDETVARLQSYSWPGNVRELKNVVERLQLSRLLEDPKVAEKMAQAGFRGPRPISAFYFFRFVLPCAFAAVGALYLFLVPPVLIAGVLGGWGPGLLATTLGLALHLYAAGEFSNLIHPDSPLFAAELARACAARIRAAVPGAAVDASQNAADLVYADGSLEAVVLAS